MTFIEYLVTAMIAGITASAIVSYILSESQKRICEGCRAKHRKEMSEHEDDYQKRYQENIDDRLEECRECQTRKRF